MRILCIAKDSHILSINKYGGLHILKELVLTMILSLQTFEQLDPVCYFSLNRIIGSMSTLIPVRFLLFDCI